MPEGRSRLKVGVVGLGKLGLPLSLVLAKAGLEVSGVDISEERIREIKALFLKSPEPRVAEYLQRYANPEFSTDYKILRDVPVIIVITQTPSLADGYFDLSYVERAVKKIHSINEGALILVSSNINIGSMDRLFSIHRRVCYNPEFVAQGTIIRDFENPKFVVIGAYSEEDGEQAANIWRKVHRRPIYIVKPTEAELAKLSLNLSYSLAITFANMIGELCEKYDARTNEVLDIIYQDRRNYSAGLGFGGPCFPRDVNCFKATCLEKSAKSGYSFADLLNKLNDYTVRRYVSKIKSLGKKRIGVLGVAYKPNVPYVYDSQSLKIVQQLEKDGYEIYVYDILAEENAKRILRKARFCTTQDECVRQVDVIFIGTPNFSGTRTGKPTVDPWV